MKKILLAGLCAGLIGCSAGRTNLLLSKSKIDGVFNGVADNYEPTIITLEKEGEKFSEKLSPLMSGFYGTYGAEYEMGLDAGLKYSSQNFYTKGKIGFGYESKNFAEQRTHVNLHVNFGMGIEENIGRHIISAGGVFNHFSNGSTLFKNLGANVKTEDNRGINTLGLELGFSF